MRVAVVLGTGLMAPGIAAACAAAGLETRVAGRSNAKAAAAAARAAGLAGSPIAPAALEVETFADAGLVVETVVEDLAVKRELLGRVERWLPPAAVVASNTSSLPIGSLAESLERPERLAGLHFLNPAERTAVVEVVAGPDTARATLDELAALARRMGKRPLLVRRDVPGFIWNRLQFAVLRECLHLLEEGVSDVASIDAAIAEGLAPRWLAAGPLATADLGGVRTFALVARGLFPHLAAGVEVPEALTARAEAGGFYHWTPESRRALEAVRAEALAFSREVDSRRAAATPPAFDAAEERP